MSMMLCKGCDQFVDTDFDLDGIWDDGPPYGYTCTACTERAEREAQDALQGYEEEA